MTSTEIITMADKDTSTVVFLGTAETYPPNEDLVCRFKYTTKDGCFDDTCWVGIFKVGWEESCDFLARIFLMAKAEKESEMVLVSNNVEELLFCANEVPDESDTEFYQFCFVTGDGVILGASCPFLITRKGPTRLSGSLLDLSAKPSGSSNESRAESQELEWCPWLGLSGEDVDDTVLVHNKTTLLESSLAKLVKENNNLREMVQSKETQIDDLYSGLQEMQEELSAAKIVMEARIEDKRKQQDFDMKLIDELQGALAKEVDEKQNLQEGMHGMEVTMASLHAKLLDSRSDYEAIAKALEHTKTSVRSELHNKYEKLLENSSQRLEEVENLLIEEKNSTAYLKTQHQIELQKITQSFQSVFAELTAQNIHIENVESQKKELMERVNMETRAVAEERRNLIDAIEEKDKEIRNIQRKLKELENVHLESVVDMQEKLDESKKIISELEESEVESNKVLKIVNEEYDEKEYHMEQELKNCKVKLDEAEINLNSMKCELAEMKEENLLLKEKSNGHNGARHALQIAYVHTQKQLASLKGDHDVLSQQYQSLRDQTMEAEGDIELRELKKQIEDLKLRLCIGGNAYKEKFLECRRMQHEIARLRQRLSSMLPAAYASHVFHPDDAFMADTAAKVAKDQETIFQQAGLDENGKKIFGQMQAVIDCKDKELKHFQQTSDASRRDQETLVFKLTSEIRLLERTVQRKDAIIDKVKELAAEEANELRRQLMEYADMVQPNQLSSGMVENRQMKEVPPAHVVDATHLGANTNQSFDQKNPRRDEHVRIYYPPPASLLPRGGQSGADLHRKAGDKPSLLLVAQGSPSHTVKQKSDVHRGEETNEPLKCPVCSMIFPRGTTDVAATNHVNKHFPEDVD